MFFIAFSVAVAAGFADAIVGLLIFERANRPLPPQAQMNPFSIATPDRVRETRRLYHLAEPKGKLLLIRKGIRVVFLLAAALMFMSFVQTARRGEDPLGPLRKHMGGSPIPTESR